MATNVKITCKYYQLREFKGGDITENKYNLLSWLNRLNSLSLEDRYKDINGVSGRIEEITKFEDTNIYALNFMRMDDISTSYKLRKDSPAEHVDIEVGEYMAKNTVCLYDSDTHLIMIQSNRGGYAESSIESYINDFFEEKVCAICPIMENVNIMGERAEYMKLDVRFANIKEYRPHRGSFFEGFIDKMNKIQGLKAHVEISLGQNKFARLDKNEMRSTISDLLSNRECISSARVKLKDDQVTGIYDLFDNLCKSDITITIGDDDKGCLKFDKLAMKMYNTYSFQGAKNRVLNAIEA